MQSACHVESVNRGKLVYSSHTAPSVLYREAIWLDGTMFAKFFEDQGQFLELTIIVLSVIWGCFPYLANPAIPPV